MALGNVYTATEWVRVPVSALLGACVLSAVWWLGFYPNYHPVREGELYRSAQLSVKTLDWFTERDGLRTVINLRGSQPGSSWWHAETRLCARRGVHHMDVHWSNQTIPSHDELMDWVGEIKTLPQPVLIHCRFVADRTSLGCALYLREVEGMDDSKANACFAPRYRHLPWVFLKVRVRERLFDRFTRYDSR